MKDIDSILLKNLAKNRYSNYVHPSYELEKKLILNIKKADFNSSIAILKEINSIERANLSKKPLSSLKYSLVASCTLFARATIEAGVDSETVFILSDHYINLIDECCTINDTQLLEYHMLDNFIHLLSTHKSFLYSPLINKAIAYIKQNIEGKLLLENIANHLGVHPNYLSYAFKKEVGKTVLYYITSIRIHTIKIYLTHTQLSFKEISDIFGFSHVSYFSHFCKMHLDVSPKEYRKGLSSF